MDVLLQAGINPSLLIGKSGKNIRFLANGKKRLAFGSSGKNARITINDTKGDIESEIKEGDLIKVAYAQNGKDACPKVSEFIENINSKSIYVDNKLINIEPMCTINESIREIKEEIKDGDEVRVFIPESILLLKKYILKNDKVLFKDNEEINDDFILEDGIKLYTKSEEEEKEEEEKLEELIVQENSDTGESFVVIVNKEEILLKGKSNYIFVDIFNYIKFDLTTIKGNIKVLLNGEKASYTDKITKGDEIEVFWE
jgi:molybdopterin converting factor small subunit